jgi:hypothetical protein
MVEYKDVVLVRLEDAVEDAKKVGGTVEVAAAGNTFYAEPCMGDLVALGYMTKKYVNTGIVDAHEIEWTLNKNAGFTVDNGYDVIAPGETVVWEK